jgi:hypothetical protein
MLERVERRERREASANSIMKNTHEERGRGESKCGQKRSWRGDVSGYSSEITALQWWCVFIRNCLASSGADVC